MSTFNLFYCNMLIGLMIYSCFIFLTFYHSSKLMHFLVEEDFPWFIQSPLCHFKIHSHSMMKAAVCFLLNVALERFRFDSIVT